MNAKDRKRLEELIDVLQDMEARGENLEGTKVFEEYCDLASDEYNDFLAIREPIIDSEYP